MEMQPVLRAPCETALTAHARLAWLLRFLWLAVLLESPMTSLAFWGAPPVDGLLACPKYPGGSMGGMTRLEAMGTVHGGHEVGVGTDHADLVMGLEAHVQRLALAALIID